MQSNSMRLATSMLGARQDMASHSYNTAGTMRNDMGALKNGQPSLPKPLQSMTYVNLGGPAGNAGVNPKGQLPSGYAGVNTTRAFVGNGNNHPDQHINDMGNNPTHPAAQLASYLFSNRLTDPANFFRG